MIISHSKGFVFIRIPKNASNAIAVALTRHLKKGDVSIIQPNSYDELNSSSEHTIIIPGEGTVPSPHVTLKNLKDFPELHVPDHYTKIIVVRNPYDKFISACVNVLRRSDRAKNGEIDWNNITSDDLKEAYKSHANSVEFDNYDWFIGGLSNVHVLRYENLQYDFDCLCRSLGLPEEPLDIIYSGMVRQSKYRELYTPGLKAVVERIHKDDFKRFDYKW